ncbi:MAG TPA: AMP-binding protein, partial [Solirubrobacteraceae bacterium]
MSDNLAGLLTNSAARFPERPALRLDDTVTTYETLNDAASRVAGLLKDRGLQPGDRVGIMLPNVPYFGVVYYGVMRAGGVVVPMNVLLKSREARFYLSDPGAKHLFAWHEFADAANQAASEAGAEATMVVPGEFEELLAGAPSDPEDAEREP